MAFLQKGTLVDGRIKFQYEKKPRIYDIKITEQMQAILKILSLKETKRIFIFQY